MNSYLNTLLEKKTTQSTEVELHLFEFCNLNCSFCGQDHNSKVGMNNIREKTEQVIRFIESSPLDKHTINIMGGEIFNDEIPLSLFDDYLFFYNRINDYCNECSKEVRFNWVTNLIFRDRIEAVQGLFSRMGSNAFISTSYDFSGRGLNINRSLQFKHNLKLFSSKVGVVGFVLTKPSIKKLLRDEDKYFKEVLYPNYHLYFDYYVPEKAADKMLPTEQDMLDAFNFMAEHYPNIDPVKQMLENDKNEMTCFSLNKKTILQDGGEVVCRYLQYKEDDFLTPIDFNNNENIIESHLERNNCLTCPYFDRCQFRCFVQADWKDLVRLPDGKCFIKEFFKRNVK